jgi:hypothetical protein
VRRSRTTSTGTPPCPGAARPDGLEVWNGVWGFKEEAALRVWHQLLRNGWDIVANGGSDLHGISETSRLTVGTPTTVVYASALARGPIVDAVRAGRSYITRRPDGVQVYLTAAGPDGQHTYTGGRIHAGAGAGITVNVLVRRGGGMRLRVLTGDGPTKAVTLDSDEQTFEVPVTMNRRDTFVRAEVREETRPAGRLPRPGMEAFTNPIRLVHGPTPTGTAHEHAPPPVR